MANLGRWPGRADTTTTRSRRRSGLRGYAGTAVSDLRQATGLLPGSIYFAFGSKEQMFRVTVERYATQLGRAIASEREGVAALEALAEHALEHQHLVRGALLGPAPTPSRCPRPGPTSR